MLWSIFVCAPEVLVLPRADVDADLLSLESADADDDADELEVEASIRL